MAVEPAKIVCLAISASVHVRVHRNYFALLSKYLSHGATTDLQMSNTVMEATAKFLN